MPAAQFHSASFLSEAIAENKLDMDSSRAMVHHLAELAERNHLVEGSLADGR